MVGPSRHAVRAGSVVPPVCIATAIQSQGEYDVTLLTLGGVKFTLDRDISAPVSVLSRLSTHIPDGRRYRFVGDIFDGLEIA